MVITSADIVFALSGGNYNSNSNFSIGGEPSGTTVLGRRLFDNVSKEEADEGMVDYRCLYVVNNSTTSGYWHSTVYIESEVEDGADIQIGVNTADDIQEITITGDCTGGDLDLTYDETTVTADFDADGDIFADNIETALKSILYIDGYSPAKDVVVEKVSSIDIMGGFSSIVFRITFSGEGGNRYHPALVLESNLSDDPLVVLVKIVNGAPINSVAVELDRDTTPPTGVTFSYPTVDEPLLIGSLRPQDSYPVWIKRTVNENTPAMENDGFTLHTIGMS